MEYQEARAYLDDAAQYGSVLGLTTIRILSERLENPQDGLRFIHIAGTNGKGSVLAFLSTVLTEAGYRVGRYLSPAVFSYRERIQVDGVPIDRESLRILTERIKIVIDGMTREGLPHPTAFEIETALSFLYFKEKCCDLVVLETGMGGDLDATNVISDSVLEILTPIGLDHTAYLGDTIAGIARHKAGIIRPHTTVVSARQRPEAMDVIREVCDAAGSTLLAADAGARAVRRGRNGQSFSYGGYRDLAISLLGTFQIENACLSVQAADALGALGYPVSEEALRAGLKKTKWPGRFTVLRENPYFIIDGAHNRDGAAALADSLACWFPGKKMTFLMGVLRDKDYRSVIAVTAPFAERVIAVETPGNARALPAQELAKAWEPYDCSVTAEKDIARAVRTSLQKAGRDDVILAFGTLSFLDEIVRAFRTAEGRK